MPACRACIAVGCRPHVSIYRDMRARQRVVICVLCFLFLCFSAFVFCEVSVVMRGIEELECMLSCCVLLFVV